MKYKSIFQSDFEQDFCYRCGKYGPTDWHHIFNAADKKRSEEYGAMIKVCRQCHEAIHSCEMQKYKEMAQIEIMYQNDMTEDEFRKEFGKSYLKGE